MTPTHPNHFWFAASVPILSKFGWLVFENLTILPFFCYRDKSPLKNEPASRGPFLTAGIVPNADRADHPEVGPVGSIVFCDIIDERPAPARLRSTSVVQFGISARSS